MPTEVDRREVQRLHAEGAQLVDVLPESEYASSHLPGAVNIPVTELAEVAHELLDRSRPVITYCKDTL